MKVLLITDNHTISGGAENYFFDLKARLKKHLGIDVYSIGFGSKQISGEDFFVLKSSNSKIAKLIWRFLFHPIIYFRIKKLLRKIQPDVIHIHNMKQYPVSLLKAVQTYPIVKTMHDFSFICPTGQNLHKDLQPCPTGFRIRCLWQHHIKFHLIAYLALIPAFYTLRNRLKKTVQKVIAPSPLLADYLKNNHFRDVCYIPPFKPEKKSHSFEKMNSYHFLFAGNLGNHKGVMTLLEEFALACQKNSALLLYIAGLGPEETRMRDRIKLLEIQKNVVFLGWQASLDKLYEECIAVIFPSIGLESFGLVMLEGMSHARPIIGTNRGTIAWLIEDNKTGLLFDPVKKGNLAEKILAIAHNTEFAKTLGMRGYEKLEELIDNENVLEQIICTYHEAIKKGARSTLSDKLT